MKRVTPEAMEAWCRAVLGLEEAERLSLDEYLAAIPTLSELADLPKGTPVLVRGDLDAKPGKNIGQGDVRLRSMVETLEFGRERGWKQVVFGHLGRDPAKSLGAVAGRLGELLKTEVPLLDDWLDPQSMTITDSAAQAVRSAQPGSVLVLQNTRKYEIERVLWKAKEADLPRLAQPLAQIANEYRDKLAAHYVNEALSAGSLDTSTVVVPAAMDRACLGRYVHAEFTGPLRRCQAAELVVFSGLKTDKLDDMEAMIARGKIRWVISAGSLAMALKKAAEQLEGRSFSLGLSEDPANKDQPYYIAPARIEQATRMLQAGRDAGIRFVLPVDFVLADGTVSETIGPGQQQLDIGPRSSEAFEQAISQFIAQGAGGRVAFYNGVFGKFEDPQFAEGTRRFIPQLKRMKDAGIEVYVGGGEGGAALEQYGQSDWVTHVFTAGGTVLNALGSEPVPYLVALRRAAG